MSGLGTAFRHKDTAMTKAIEVKCIKTVTASSKRRKEQKVFTAGEIYIAVLSKYGTYSADTDTGATRTFTKEEFYEIFEEVN